MISDDRLRDLVAGAIGPDPVDDLFAKRVLRATGGRPIALRKPMVLVAAMALLVSGSIAGVSLMSRPQTPLSVDRITKPHPGGLVDVVTEPVAGGEGYEVTFDRGARTSTASSPAPDGSTPQPPVSVARVRRCVGDPPRQIEDPQSPPCVPSWFGDNGGVTAKGVTRDEIRVAVPSDVGADVVSRFANFFNRAFEFYGRALRLVTYAAPGSDAAQQRAAAAQIDEQYHVFAALTPATPAPELVEELSRRNVLTVSGTALHNAGDAGVYRWQYPMALDAQQELLGEWVCSRLAGGNATHAGPGLNVTRRSFGIVIEPYDDAITHTSLSDAMASCNTPSAATVVLPRGSDTVAAQDAVLRMQTSGVTSGICLCTAAVYRQLATTATSRGYLPEWILSSYGDLDTSWSLVGIGAEQLSHAFGLTVKPRQILPTREPSSTAQSAVDPSTSPSALSMDVAAANRVYRQLLLLASGIQMAGPNLTPQNVERGLESTVFQNPPSPFNPGRVGFASGSHSMTLDAAEWWFSPTSSGPYTDTAAGAICYVDAGARRTSWDSGDPFFTGVCDSGR